MSDDRSVIIKANEAFVDEWLKAVDSAPAASYVEVTDLNGLPDGARVLANSTYWAGVFFVDTANPYRQKTPVKLAIHRATPDTFDMIRRDYSPFTGPLHLVVIETLQFILIRIEQTPDHLATLMGAQLHKAIDSVAHEILKMSGVCMHGLVEAPYHWKFEYPDHTAQEMRFSTDPLASPLRMGSWAGRVDGGIHQGKLFFMCYKKAENTSGKIATLDGQHWFDGKY